MNFLKETKQHYFCVMIIEFIFLSCVYWLFFPFSFSSALFFLLATIFYITGYRFWIKVLNNKEHMLLYPSEHFTIINFIILLSILAFNSLSVNGFNDGMFFIYATVFTIFFSYYIYRLQKQKKSPVPASKFSSTLKSAIILGCIFLLFDFLFIVQKSLIFNWFYICPFCF